MSQAAAARSLRTTGLHIIKLIKFLASKYKIPPGGGSPLQLETTALEHA